ncbi:MAG: hypothetical protein NTV62_03255 [Candidatus Gribaldobacteria bacterium]|nr:hypothetical protein [Candidatus Gribaldobacteria bacterium]
MKWLISIDCDDVLTWFHVFFFSDAKRVIKKWLNAGYNIAIVSARPCFSTPVTKSLMICNHLSKVTVKHVGPNVSKAEALTGRHIMIDNLIENLLKLRDVVPHLWLFRPQAESGVEEIEGFPVVRNWLEIEAKMDKLVQIEGG